MNRPALCLMILAAIVAAPQAASAQGLGRRYDLAELQQIAQDATLLVRAKATAEPVSKGGSPDGYVWETPFELIEAVKGEDAPKTFTLWLKSPLSDLNTTRANLPDKEFVLPLVPAPGGQGGYRLVGDVGFAVDRAEATTLIRAAGGKVVPPAAGQEALRLRVEPMSPPFVLGQPVMLRVSLVNTAEQVVTYEQAPFEVRQGRLYILGGGNLIVTNTRRSMAVDAGENVQLNAPPPPPPLPVTIIPGGSYTRDIDLAQFYGLTEPGLYMATMAVTAPDGQALVRSGTVQIQVIAPLAAPVDVPAPETRTTAESLLVPAPEAYQPGDIQNGLCGLLRPNKAQTAVGEPILVELRLLNAGDRTFSVDTRLERVLVLSVKEQGDSPPALRMLQRIDWPLDAADAPPSLAYLRPHAFWGKTLNVNSLYGRDEASLMQGGKAAVAGAVEPTFETHGMTLFAFEKPGVYRITATYQMAPKGGDGPRLWAGKLETNPIFIRVVPAEQEGPAPIGMER